MIHTCRGARTRHGLDAIPLLPFANREPKPLTRNLVCVCVRVACGDTETRVAQS
jgi:hypothetical protein